MDIQTKFKIFEKLLASSDKKIIDYIFKCLLFTQVDNYAMDDLLAFSASPELPQEELNTDVLKSIIEKYFENASFVDIMFIDIIFKRIYIFYEYNDGNYSSIYSISFDEYYRKLKEIDKKC